MQAKSTHKWTSWEAESLRLTAFPIPSTMPSGHDSWWEAITGVKPETVINQASAGTYQAGGLVKIGGTDFRAGLVVAPNRIDWFLGPDFKQGSTFDLLKFTLGPVEEPWTFFEKLSSKWLTELCPPISRLAFGAVLVMRVPDRVSGYRKLGEFIPAVQLDPEGSSDFFYSINRPRPSKTGISDLIINRATNWSVGHISPVQFMFSVPGGAQVSGIPSVLSINICRLECDLNTKPEGVQELPHDRLTDVFGELMSLGVEIADRGDIK